MQNFSIDFSYSAWLLLLIIPALLLTLIPYFRLSKKYRRTRNRITSIVLHIIVMTLAISVLSGMTFSYELPNKENEIILLVDVSESEEQSQINRDEFVQTVLQDSQFDHYKVGIVTFGYDQEYAVPLTDDIDKIYNKYINAELPDTSATNIAGALEYAKDLFKNPESGKIVLITDGKETDREASSVIRSVTAYGISVDTVYISSAYEGDDVQLIDVELPDYYVRVGEECQISVTVQSKTATSATIEMYDNDQLDSVTGRQAVELVAGTQSFSFKHTFQSQDLHELQFKIIPNGDVLEQNNEYYSYLYLEVYNKILILERTAGESDNLVNMLNEQEEYQIDVFNSLSTDVPTTVEGLCAYDQVILNNIANRDMPEGFDVILESYVNDYGGGLFTVGGNDEYGNANAYNREDMYATLYQQMLPVQAIDYTPPVGVVVIIDCSGSMASSADDGGNKLDYAKAGASACLTALTERDYIGIMTLDSVHSTILELTPRTQETKILTAINSIEKATGGTVFPGAIERAGQSLRALTAVDKRHIVIVTDGEVPEEQQALYESLITEFYEEAEITLSIVGVGMKKGSTAEKQMQRAVDLGHGRLHIIEDPQADSIMYAMREDLNVPAIEEVNYETFNPIVYDAMSPLVQDLERAEEGENRNRLTVSLDGFYGVKARAAADLILVGNYQVPIYAQWKYGKGMVGSFMCDLNGTWSAQFILDVNGKTFIHNVVNNLMPTENIRPNEIRMDLKEDNYTNQISVYTNLEEGEYITGSIENVSTGDAVSLNSLTEGEKGDLRLLGCYVTASLNADNNYSRSTFVLKDSGIYKITLIKCDVDGVELARYETYKAFSYSEEYDTFVEESEEDLQTFLTDLAEKGNGVKIADAEDPWEIFASFITGIVKRFDPTLLFTILAITLFLLDIAVRKFKFKWPHELIRDYKNKKFK